MYEKNGNLKLAQKFQAIAKRLRLKQTDQLKKTELIQSEEEVLNGRNVQPTELANQHGDPDPVLYEGSRRKEKLQLSNDD